LDLTAQKLGDNFTKSLLQTTNQAVYSRQSNLEISYFLHKPKKLTKFPD